MKVGFHFNADHDSLGYYYGLPIKERIFKILLEKRTLNIFSKIFIGDLLLMQHSCDKIKEGNSIKYTFNQEKYSNLFHSWLFPNISIWRNFKREKMEEAINHNIFVICFESIDYALAEYIDEQLSAFEPYLGALEIEESLEHHYVLYSGSLIAMGRLINKDLSLFYQEEDDKDAGLKEEFEEFGFKSVKYECLNFRYTIFDTYHNYDHARRVAEWKKGFGSFLAFIADDVVSRLSDIAPDLGNKLWSALKTFENAETNEQIAQVTASCRRIFEYVIDSIFPPSDEKSEDGHSLKGDKYKNRIYEFAKNSRIGNTNIDLITASTETLFKQWEKLNNLANKGVHGEVFRNEGRRCMIRTVLLLDDIISLKNSAFEIKTSLDFGDIFGSE